MPSPPGFPDSGFIVSTVNSPNKDTEPSPRAEESATASVVLLPATFDIVPALYTLLSRLVPSPTSSDPPLDPQQLAIEASSIKIRLQKARSAVEALPDMERTIEQQEVEIRELEERIRTQRNILAALAVEVRKDHDDDQLMHD